MSTATLRGAVIRLKHGKRHRTFRVVQGDDMRHVQRAIDDAHRWGDTDGKSYEVGRLAAWVTWA